MLTSNAALLLVWTINQSHFNGSCLSCDRPTDTNGKLLMSPDTGQDGGVYFLLVSQAADWARQQTLSSSILPWC